MAISQDIEIDQGSTFEMELVYKKIDGTIIPLTGYTCRGEIRRDAQTSTVIETFTCTIPTPLTGQIFITLTEAETEGIPTTGLTYKDKELYYYDIELINGAVVERILNGAVYVSPEITK